MRWKTLVTPATIAKLNSQAEGKNYWVSDETKSQHPELQKC